MGMDTADPERQRLAESMRRPSSLDDVAEAVAAATEHEHLIYVERCDAGYRWSLVHRGGPYPLLRSYARFLRVDHHSLVVAFATDEHGLAYIPAEEGASSTPITDGLFEFGYPATAAEARSRILDSLG